MQTAQYACAPLGVEVTLDRRLAGEPFDAYDIVAGLGEVLLVGHDPSFTLTLHDLTGAQARMRKGGLAGIAKGELVVLVRPAELSAISGRERVHDRARLRAARDGGHRAARGRGFPARSGAGPARPRALRQPRALVAGLQRSRPAVGRGRVAAADRAPEVPGDLRLKPRRVLHDPSRRGARPGRRPRRSPRPRRPHPDRGAGGDPRPCPRARSPSHRTVLARRPARAGRARHPHRQLR